VPVKEVERFSRRTRRYLSRRVLRYFRRLGRRDPERYGKTVRGALLLYEDDHLREPAQLLNAWGLVHILYWGSPVLVRSPHGVRLAEGAALADLAPAPLTRGPGRASSVICWPWRSVPPAAPSGRSPSPC
jgi:hypothetical protein